MVKFFSVRHLANVSYFPGFLGDLGSVRKMPPPNMTTVASRIIKIILMFIILCNNQPIWWLCPEVSIVHFLRPVLNP